MSFSRARAMCVVLRRFEQDVQEEIWRGCVVFLVCDNVLCSLRHPNLTKTTDPTSQSAENLSIFRTFARNSASFFSGLSIVLCRACACVALRGEVGIFVRGGRGYSHAGREERGFQTCREGNRCDW